MPRSKNWQDRIKPDFALRIDKFGQQNATRSILLACMAKTVNVYRTKKIKRNLTARIADSELNLGKSEFYLSANNGFTRYGKRDKRNRCFKHNVQVNAGRGTRDLNRDKDPPNENRSAGLCDYFYYSASVVTEEPSSSSIRW